MCRWRVYIDCTLYILWVGRTSKILQTEYSWPIVDIKINMNVLSLCCCFDIDINIFFNGEERDLGVCYRKSILVFSWKRGLSVCPGKGVLVFVMRKGS